MSCLYITEYGAKVSLEANYVKVKVRDGKCRNIPIETLESVHVISGAQITTQCLVEFMKRKISVSYFSSGGHYYGRIEPAVPVHAGRQRKQAGLYDTKFALELGKNILGAKVKNQAALLRRYARSRKSDVSEEIKMMNICYGKIYKSNSYHQMIGYEGGAAKYYFQGLGKVVDKKFCFSGRSKRPPKDEFNAMLSLGYSLLMNEIHGIIESKGLNPYFGFIHRDKEGHPTLASDLMEEWRPIMVDAVTMSLVNGHEIFPEYFYQKKGMQGYFLTREGLKIFIHKFEKKRRTETRYLSYVDYPVSFGRAMELQVNQLIKAIESGEAALYQPICIR